jgi:hypothetical protein
MVDLQARKMAKGSRRSLHRVSVSSEGAAWLFLSQGECNTIPNQRSWLFLGDLLSCLTHISPLDTTQWNCPSEVANTTCDLRFGIVATVLEEVPLASILFSFTNTGKFRSIYHLQNSSDGWSLTSAKLVQLCGQPTSKLKKPLRLRILRQGY